MRSLTLLLVILIYLNSYSQRDEDNNLALLSYGGKIVYIDNNYKSWMTCFLDGDSAYVMEEDSRFIVIDDKQIVQFMKYPIPDGLYYNSMVGASDTSLLNHFMAFEKDFFETEVFNTRLNIEKEYLQNDFGKNFLLWYFKVPESDAESRVRYQFYLLFTMNDYVGLINVFAENEVVFNDQYSYLKSLVDRIVVYGFWIDLENIYHKIESWDTEADYIHSDSIYGFSVRIPYWLNKCATNNDNYWLYNFPDSANVKNAMGFVFYDIDQFTGMYSFNDHIMSQEMIYRYFPDDHKIQEKDISSKVLNKMDGVTYHCHFNTFKTKNYFVWINFTATEATYEFNIRKYLEVLNTIEIFDK
jgi:hypothetical protein